VAFGLLVGLIAINQPHNPLRMTHVLVSLSNVLRLNVPRSLLAFRQWYTYNVVSFLRSASAVLILTGNEDIFCTVLS